MECLDNDRCEKKFLFFSHGQEVQVTVCNLLQMMYNIEVIKYFFLILYPAFILLLYKLICINSINANPLVWKKIDQGVREMAKSVR